VSNYVIIWTERDSINEVSIESREVADRLYMILADADRIKKVSLFHRPLELIKATGKPVDHATRTRATASDALPQEG